MVIGIEASHANKEKRTGVEEYAWQLIERLKKIIPADVRVILYTNSPLRAPLSDLPPNWREKILKWPFGKMWSQFRLSWEFFSRPPDVFFAPGQLLPFVCPPKTVATIHDSAFLVYPNAYHFFGRQYLKWMNRQILKKSRLILTPSEFSKAELKRLYNFDTSRVRVTPLGLNRAAYGGLNLSDAEKREILGRFKITKPFFISVGRLEEKKNTANIVRAYNIFRTKHDAQLVLIGIPGCGIEEIEKEIESSLYRSDIVLPGWGDKSDIVKLYNLAQALVFPSNYEGFGLPVLEAMVSGCPVIASRGNSLEEVGGDAAIYVSAGSAEEIAVAMERVIFDPELRANMVEKGMGRTENFSWENTAKLTWAALSEAAK